MTQFFIRSNHKMSTYPHIPIARMRLKVIFKNQISHAVVIVGKLYHGLYLL